MSYKSYKDYPTEHLQYDYTVDLDGSIVIAYDKKGNRKYTSDDLGKVLNNIMKQGTRIFIRKASAEYPVKTIISLVSDVVIESKGAILKQSDGANLTTIFDIRNVSNVKIKGLKIRGNAGNQATSFNVISISATSTDVENIEIENVEIDGGWNPSLSISVTGIVLSAISPYKIRKVKIIRNRVYDVINAIYSYGLTEDVTIEDNEIERVNALRNAIFFDDVRGANVKVFIRKNKVIKATNNPIVINGSEIIEVEDNYLESEATYWADQDSGGSGDQIRLTSCKKFKIRGNIIYRSGDMGITIEKGSSKGVIEGNIIMETDARGINLVDIDAEINDVTVKGNIVINPIRNYSSRTIDNPSGILLRGCKRCIVEGNRVVDETGAMSYGVEEANGSATTSDYNIIKNNIITGYATGAISTIGSNTIASDNIG